MKGKGGGFPPPYCNIMRITCEDGDLFTQDISYAISLGCTNIHGEHWKMWGRWVYDEDTSLLLALFSKGFGKHGLIGACAIRPEYEEHVKGLGFQASNEDKKR